VTPEVQCSVDADDVIPKRKFVLSMPTCYVNSQLYNEARLFLEVSTS